MLEQLERTRARGEAVCLADAGLRAATERRLQLAVQICIDIGAHLVSGINARAPADYADIFSSLSEARSIEPWRNGWPGRLCSENLLVHSYVDLDHRRISESLGHLDDLREFAAAVQRIVDADA